MMWEDAVGMTGYGLLGQPSDKKLNTIIQEEQ